jgi:hypothetical protein
MVAKTALRRAALVGWVGVWALPVACGSGGSSGSTAVDAGSEAGGSGGTGGSGGSAGGTDAAADSASDDTCGNGLDDDGDGQVDEGCACTAGATQPCYGGDKALAGIGLCAMGTQYCQPTGPDSYAFGDCSGWTSRSKRTATPKTTTATGPRTKT